MITRTFEQLVDQFRSRPTRDAKLEPEVKR